MKTNNLKVAEYINQLNISDLPAEVKLQAKACIKDLLASTVGGSQTKAAGLAREFAKTIWPGSEATIITAGKLSNCVGAAFANAFQANAIDIDDGFRPVKGHPGALIIPAALSVAEFANCTGTQLLEAVVAGYEVGTRAGMIWHDHYPVYHSSGSWGSLATAAVTAKLLNLNLEQTYHALGIAEYQAPIGPMMRCIDYPSMVKDGIGWGCPTGVTAAMMAAKGFTGTPSLFGFEKYAKYVDSLGHVYNILQVYFKPYACCRWAQPAIAATLDLIERYELKAPDITKIIVSTFAESASLQKNLPANAEEAQYNIAFPIAAAIIDGAVGPQQLINEKLNDPAISRLVNLIEVKHDQRFDRHFPARAESEIEIITKNNKRYCSGAKQAAGDWDNPLSPEELENKYYWLMEQVKNNEEAVRIAEYIDTLELNDNLQPLMALL